MWKTVTYIYLRYSSSCDCCIDIVNLKTWNFFHNEENLMLARTRSLMDPSWTMGGICLKSPEPMNNSPPQHLSGFRRISLSMLSTASKFSRWLATNSSQITTFACRNSSALWDVIGTVHCIFVKVSRSVTTSILNKLCAVRPPGYSDAANPLDAQQRAIWPFPLT